MECRLQQRKPSLTRLWGRTATAPVVHRERVLVRIDNHLIFAAVSSKRPALLLAYLFWSVSLQLPYYYGFCSAFDDGGVIARRSTTPRCQPRWLLPVSIGRRWTRMTSMTVPENFQKCERALLSPWEQSALCLAGDVLRAIRIHRDTMKQRFSTLTMNTMLQAPGTWPHGHPVLLRRMRTVIRVGPTTQYIILHLKAPEAWSPCLLRLTASSLALLRRQARFEDPLLLHPETQNEWQNNGSPGYPLLLARPQRIGLTVLHPLSTPLKAPGTTG